MSMSIKNSSCRHVSLALTLFLTFTTLNLITGCGDDAGGGGKEDLQPGEGEGEGEGAVCEDGLSFDEARANADERGDYLTDNVVPIPQQCRADWLEGYIVAPLEERYTDDSVGSVTVGFLNSQLVSLDGHECVPLTPGMSRDNCDQAFQCGCCTCTMEPIVGGSANAWFLDCDLFGQCPQYRLAEYRLETDEEPMGWGGSGVGSSTCQDCLSDCQGLSSCCTGSGCLCEIACAPDPSDCRAGATFCCSPYGGCYCSSSCPY